MVAAVEINGSIARAIYEDKHAITGFLWRGRWCWIAREIGRILGYEKNAVSFIRSLNNEWSDEFVAGEDLVVVEGADLAELKRLVADSATSQSGADSVPNRSPALLILFESGLNLALMKTEKPLGKTLRRWLATEVLPALRRTGSYTMPQPAPQLPPPRLIPNCISTVFPPAVHADLEHAAKRLDCAPHELVERIVDLWRADCRPLPPARPATPPTSADEAARISGQLYVMLNTTGLELERLQKLAETTRTTLGASERELHSALLMLDILHDEDAAKAMLGLVKQARSSKQSCSELMARLLGAASRLPTKS